MNISTPAAAKPAAGRARIVVVGNEKGGSGKSTTAMHLTVALMRGGLRTAAIDLDARQATLTRYLENRAAFRDRQGIALAVPAHRRVVPSTLDSDENRRADESIRVEQAVRELSAAHDVIVIDTPGSDSFLSRQGHSYADVLVTPINDSFIDFDLLATVDPNTHAIIRPSRYAEMVWEQRKARAVRDGGSIDWIVMRNRIPAVDSRNKAAVEEVLAALSRRIGFRIAPGFGERVIFRELFLKGLTVLDVRDQGTDVRLTMSHVGARHEIRALLDVVGLLPAAAVAEIDRPMTQTGIAAR